MMVGTVVTFPSSPNSPLRLPKNTAGVGAAPLVATPNAHTNTFITVTKNIPTMVKLLIRLATCICFGHLTLYLVLISKPTPTSTYKYSEKTLV